MLTPAMVMLAWLGAQATPMPTVEELETRIINARKQVTRGELILDAQDVGGRSNPIPREFHVWFDGNKLRHDCRRQSPQGTPLRQIRCRNCPTTNGYIRYDHEPNKTGGVNTVQVTRIKDKEQQNHWFDVLDPRGLGLVPSYVDALINRRMDDLLGRPDRKDLVVSRQTWKGQECFRIDFELHPKVTVQVWAVPAWGDSVVKVQLTGFTKVGTPLVEVPLVDTVDTEVARTGADGIWFPKVCTYVRTINGELETRQVAKIEVKSLNRPIDPKVFDLAGMDLPAPIPVRTDAATTKTPVMAWDGAKLTDAAPYTAVQAHPSVVLRPDVGGQYRMWFWLAAVVAALIAGTAAWRLRRQPA